jgi:hypothetical protein
MADKPDVSAAIEAALTPDSGAKPEDTGAKPEVTEQKPESTPSPKEVKEEVKLESKQEDAPTSVFGVDLSILPDDETRAKFIAEFREANKTIGKLQRDNAELRKQEVTPPAPPAPAPAPEIVEVSKLTDEQIAEALGINLEASDSPERDQREIALTRTLLEMQERQEKLESNIASTTAATTWDKAFDDLEKRYGVLPEEMPRAEVFGWAAEQRITSPEAAYWAAVGPIRAAVASALQQHVVKLKTASKKGATTPRPTSSADVDENRLQSKNVKDGIKEAFEKAREALGVTLSDA